LAFIAERPAGTVEADHKRRRNRVGGNQLEKSVDDDAMVLDVISGCEVVTAHGGVEALDQLRQNRRISILVTDINMPGMDGHELAERAKVISPELRILQLSGRERRQGGYPMIRKPFSEEDLAITMQRTTGVC
jgi:two-component system cell cycle response regulator CpdR